MKTLLRNIVSFFVILFLFSSCATSEISAPTNVNLDEICNATPGDQSTENNEMPTIADDTPRGEKEPTSTHADSIESSTEETIPLESDPDVPQETASGNPDVIETAPEFEDVQDTTFPNDDYNDNSDTSDNTSEVVPEDEMEKKKRLIVLGKDITVESGFKFADGDTRIMLPLISILKEFGASIEWTEDTKATIYLNGKSFLLDIELVSVMEEGSGRNCLLCAPGGEIYSYSGYRELCLDHISLETVLELMMQTTITVSVDWENINIEISYT